MAHTLASLIAAVRASKIADRVTSAGWDDAAIGDIVRTAASPKGAIWLATRALPVEAPSETTIQGRWDTAMRCLMLLADAGDERALAMVSAGQAHVDAEFAAAQAK